MIEHEQLVNELHLVHQMPVERRLQHAQQRRQQQIECWKMHNEETDGNKNKLKNYKKLKYPDEVLLLDATQRNDIDEVTSLLNRGVRPDIKNHDGFTAIHQCSIDGNVEILKLFIKYGANVNCVDDDGWTPLHAAVACGRLSIIRVLIENNADLLVLNYEKTFPYDMSDNIEVLTMLNNELQKKGITIDMMDDLKKNPEKFYLDFLIKGGIDNKQIILQQIDSSNATHLHFAAAYNFCQVAKYLLSLGIPIDIIDNKQWTSLHVACYFCQQAMVQLLLENDANPNLSTDKGQNAYDLCDDYDLREWMTNYVNLLNQTDSLKRRATLPPPYTTNLNDNSFRRNSIRRSSLREYPRIKKHNDNFRFVLIAKDILYNNTVDSTKTEHKKDKDKDKNELTEITIKSDQGNEIEPNCSTTKLKETNSVFIRKDGSVDEPTLQFHHNRKLSNTGSNTDHKGWFSCCSII